MHKRIKFTDYGFKGAFQSHLELILRGKLLEVSPNYFLVLINMLRMNTMLLNFTDRLRSDGGAMTLECFILLSGFFGSM